MEGAGFISNATAPSLLSAPVFSISHHMVLPTCGPLGEVEAVGVVNFGTAGLLTGNHLSSVAAAETLVLSLFGHHHLVLPLAVAPPLQLPAFVFRWRVVLVRTRYFL